MIRRPVPRPLAGLVFASVLIATSCATGGDDATLETGGNDLAPDVTLGTVPSGDADPVIDLPPVEVPPVDVPDSEPAAEGDSDLVDPDDSEPSTDEPDLVASPGADLPTEVPGAEPEIVPVTTTPGPLPTPAIRLLTLGEFDQPVEASVRPDDVRLFVVQQSGSVVAIDDESAVQVFDISAVDVGFSAGGEQGLLGLAFHPDESLAYVDFTNGSGDTVVAEFVVDPMTAQFDPASYREVITIGQPFGNHNGGELAFGPDGFLYIGLGDGGSADDPNRSALDLGSRLGKILRIDPLPSTDAPFTVPDDNPFVGVDGADPTIWSLGLRNPWKFSFDSLTGDLWIGDVGQNQLEEIDLARALDGVDAGKGVSFGWSAFEAADRFNGDQPEDGHTLPVVSYPHENGACSVSGGVVARNSSVATLNGWFVYGDYCSGTLWALDTTSVTSTPDGPVGEPVIVELGTVGALSAVVEGPTGEIYALSNAGPLQLLVPA